MELEETGKPSREGTRDGDYPLEDDSIIHNNFLEIIDHQAIRRVALEEIGKILTYEGWDKSFPISQCK